MNKILKRAALAIVTVVTAATPLLLSPARPAAALSSCPTDPLAGLTPYETNYNDANAVNVGVKFNVNGAPYITGVKFYKGVDNTGTHVAHLRLAGEEADLASKTYTSETSSGWQTVTFDDPVPLVPGWDNEYVVWVSMPNGHYAVDGGMAGGSNHFNNGPFGNRYQDVVYIKDGESGFYEYTSDHEEVPTNETEANYWVSPIIADSVDPYDVDGFTATDDTAGTILDWTTAAGDDNEAYTAGFNTVRTDFIRNDGVASTVVGSQYSNAPYWVGATGEQQDTTALPGQNYTYTVKVYDGCGNASEGVSDAASTASQSLSRIFSSNPANVDTATTPVVVGMHWQTSTAGKVWGARIHRGAGTMPSAESGERLRATLWDNDGSVLASAFVPAGNQQTGWIDVRFDEPVTVSANHDYVIGYYSPNGKESYTNNTFTSAVTNGSLTARADTGGTPNGVYAQGGGTGSTTFPTTRAGNSTWYGVDVNFFVP